MTAEELQIYLNNLLVTIDQKLHNLQLEMSRPDGEQVTAIVNDLTQLGCNIMQLQNQVASMQVTVNCVNNSNNELKLNYMKLQQEIQAWEGQISQLQTDLGTVNKNLADSINKINENVVSIVNTINENLTTEKQERTVSDTMLSQRISALEDNQADVDQFKSQITNLKSSTTNLKNRMDTAESNIAELGKTVGTMQDTVANLEKDVIQAVDNAEDIAELQTKVANNTSNIASLQATVSDVQSKVSSNTANLNAIHDTVSTVEANSISMGTTVNGLKGTVASIQEQQGKITQDVLGNTMDIAAIKKAIANGDIGGNTGEGGDGNSTPITPVTPSIDVEEYKNVVAQVQTNTSDIAGLKSSSENATDVINGLSKSISDLQKNVGTPTSAGKPIYQQLADIKTDVSTVASSATNASHLAQTNQTNITSIQSKVNLLEQQNTDLINQVLSICIPQTTISNPAYGMKIRTTEILKDNEDYLTKTKDVDIIDVTKVPITRISGGELNNNTAGFYLNSLDLAPLFELTLLTSGTLISRELTVVAENNTFLKCSFAYNTNGRLNFYLPTDTGSLYTLANIPNTPTKLILTSEYLQTWNGRIGVLDGKEENNETQT